MAIGTMKLRVHIQHGLYIVIAGGQVMQIGYRVSKYVSINNNILSGLELINIFGPK